MNWLQDIRAQYRLRDAVEAGKYVVRRIDGTWFVFGAPGVDALRYESHIDALTGSISAACNHTVSPRTRRGVTKGKHHGATPAPLASGARVGFTGGSGSPAAGRHDGLDCGARREVRGVPGEVASDLGGAECTAPPGSELVADR